MSYHRYNVSVVTGNYTGATTGSVTNSPSVNGNSVFVGKDEQKVFDLAAHVVATSTLTGATMKLKWQGSNDNSAWVDLANNAANSAASTAFITGGTGITATIGIDAPPAAYAYKYARPVIVWTSTTAGTTNDVVSVGLNYRQFAQGNGL